MKKINMRRWMLGVLMMLMLSMMTGCSHEPTTLEIVSKMNRAIAEVSQVSMDWDFTTQLEIDGVNENTTFRLKGNTLGDVKAGIAQMTGNATLKLPERKIKNSMEVWNTQKNSSLTHYEKLGEFWVKSETVSQERKLLQLNVMEEFQSLKDVFIMDPDQTVAENPETYRLRAVLSPDDLRVLVEDYATMMYLDEETKNYGNLLQKIDWTSLGRMSIDMTLCVDKNTYLPRTLCVSPLFEVGTTEKEAVAGGSLDLWNLGGKATDILLTAEFGFPENTTLSVPEEALAGLTRDELAVLLESENAAEENEEVYPNSMYRNDGTFLLLDEYEPGAYPLVSEENFEIDLIRVYENASHGGYADIQMTNKGKSDLDIYVRGVASNQTMLPKVTMYRNIPKGSTVHYTLQLEDAEIRPEALENIYVEFVVVDAVNVYVEDYNSGVVIYRKGSSSCEVLHSDTEEEETEEAAGESFAPVAPEHAQDPGQMLTVQVLEPTEDAGQDRIPMELTNTSGENIVLEGYSFRDYKGTELHMSLSGVIFDECRLLTDLYLDADTLAVLQANMEEAEELSEDEATLEESSTESSEEAEDADEESLEEASEEEEIPSDEEDSEEEEELSEEEPATEEETEKTELLPGQIRYAIAAYILEDYPTSPVFFQYMDLVISCDSWIMKLSEEV